MLKGALASNIPHSLFIAGGWLSAVPAVAPCESTVGQGSIPQNGQEFGRAAVSKPVQMLAPVPISVRWSLPSMVPHVVIIAYRLDMDHAAYAGAQKGYDTKGKSIVRSSLTVCLITTIRFYEIKIAFLGIIMIGVAHKR